MLKTRRGQKGGVSRSRSITLTTSIADFDKVRKLEHGKVVTIECVNDIVSSLCRGLTAVRGMPHEYNRRYDLLCRAWRGNCRTVYVRTVIDFKVKAVLKRIHTAESDASAFKVSITI